MFKPANVLIRLTDRLMSRDNAEVAEMGLWGGALTIVCATFGLAVFGLSQPPRAEVEAGPPPALIVDLSVDTDEATRTDISETGNATFNAQEVQSKSVEPVEKPSEMPDPMPDESEKTVDDKPKPDEVKPDEIKPPLPKNETVEVPQPLEMPKPETAKKPDKPAPASIGAIEAAAEVQKSDRNIARQAGAGSDASQEIMTWEGRLMAHLGHKKRYPEGSRARGETGVAVVNFSLDPAGNVLSVSLGKSSGYTDLDTEVIDLVHRASPLPRPPAGAPLQITAPVRFSIR